MVYVLITGYETECDETECEKKECEEKGEVTFTKEIDDETFFKDVPYPKVRQMIENGDLKDGMQVNVPTGYCYLSDQDELRNFIVSNITVCMESPKDPDISDSDSDNEDEKIDWANELKIEYEYDTHYGCYCKTQTVCGCGCDPLHDGW